MLSINSVYSFDKTCEAALSAGSDQIDKTRPPPITTFIPKSVITIFVSHNPIGSGNPLCLFHTSLLCSDIESYIGLEFLNLLF